MSYKKVIAILMLCISMNICGANVLPPLIPAPNSVKFHEDGPFKLTDMVTIQFSTEELKPSAKTLKDILSKRFDLELVDNVAGDCVITLTLDSALRGDEHYRLHIDKNEIKINGATPEAVFRGVMTLAQLLPEKNSEGIIALSSMTIDDSPRFGYRALMLDPARHFLPADDVKRFIDLMAKYKYNVLQLHLSDDQGFRIKLDNHPELSGDQAYTKEELEEIIAYAKERYIEIVPEIDVPGHTAAILAVYPELGCLHQHSNPIELGKTQNRMLCASNENVYVLLRDIINEISNLFPSQYIHLGGDEAAIPANWAKCDACLELMKNSGYEDPSQLMIPFFGKLLASVKENNKKPILWCELNNIYPPADDFLFPYTDDVTLVTWRNGLTPTCIELTGNRGLPLIMAPGEFTYLDYPQMKNDLPEYNNWGMPITTLTKTYQLDPGYGLPDEKQAHIMGVMGTLWGEAINNIDRATYMAFPRALALAEAGWTQMENRDWESFKERMYPVLYQLMKEGVSFRVPFEIARQNNQSSK